MFLNSSPYCPFMSKKALIQDKSNYLLSWHLDLICWKDFLKKRKIHTGQTNTIIIYWCSISIAHQTLSSLLSGCSPHPHTSIWNPFYSQTFDPLFSIYLFLSKPLTLEKSEAIRQEIPQLSVMTSRFTLIYAHPASPGALCHQLPTVSSSFPLPTNTQDALAAHPKQDLSAPGSVLHAHLISSWLYPGSVSLRKAKIWTLPPLNRSHSHCNLIQPTFKPVGQRGRQTGSGVSFHFPAH